MYAYIYTYMYIYIKNTSKTVIFIENTSKTLIFIENTYFSHGLIWSIFFITAMTKLSLKSFLEAPPLWMSYPGYV